MRLCEACFADDRLPKVEEAVRHEAEVAKLNIANASLEEIGYESDVFVLKYAELRVD